jgi:hypothetical protein
MDETIMNNDQHDDDSPPKIPSIKGE